MIVLPRVLGDLLRQTGEAQARALALDYAEAAVREAGAVLPAELAEASLALLASARRFRTGGGDMESLRSARDEFFRVRAGAGPAAREVSWIASIAVMAVAQRELEEAGVVARSAYMPGVLDVAREAQRLAGNGPARWETARAQLTRLIESEPYPGDD